MKYTRRELLKCLAAGGIVTAAGLWVPGQKVISIPSGQVFGNEYGINSTFRLIDRRTVEYIGAKDKVVSIPEFYEWLKRNASHMLKPYHSQTADHLIVEMASGNRMINPEHLCSGSLTQDSGRPEWMQGFKEKEIWSHFGNGMEGDLLQTDKIYIQDRSSKVSSDTSRVVYGRTDTLSHSME